MKNILKSAIYVGTYAKYNAGSIAGKWINLSDYTTKRAFYAACRELHKNESDPEFMFQDWENIPDSMVSESSVSDEVWHVMNSLKKFAADRAEEFAEWCEDNGAEQDYNALREFLGFNKKEKTTTTTKKGNKRTATTKVPEMTKDQMKHALLEALGGDERRADYYASRASSIATIGGHLVIFYKQSIETRFCFDDENEEAMNIYRNFTESYFIAENMRQADGLKALGWFEGEKEKYWGRIPCLYEDTKGIWRVGTATNTDIVESIYCQHYRLNDDELKQVHELLKVEKQKFEKKLQAYLKRYGLTKIHTWSYWANA